MTYFYKVEDLSKEDRFTFGVQAYSKHIFKTSNKEFQFGENIKIDNQLYVLCRKTIEGDNFYIGISKVEMKDDEDINDLYESEITCPACGSQLTDSWEMSDSDDEYQCENCGSIFSYEREIDVNYICTLVKKNTTFTEI